MIDRERAGVVGSEAVGIRWGIFHSDGEELRCRVGGWLMVGLAAGGSGFVAGD